MPKTKPIKVVIKLVEGVFHQALATDTNMELAIHDTDRNSPEEILVSVYKPRILSKKQYRRLLAEDARGRHVAKARTRKGNS